MSNRIPVVVVRESHTEEWVGVAKAQHAIAKSAHQINHACIPGKTPEPNHTLPRRIKLRSEIN